jgi:hypothetical protein
VTEQVRWEENQLFQLQLNVFLKAVIKQVWIRKVLPV